MVLVPFAAGEEDEQEQRARRLVELGLAQRVAESELSAAQLAPAIDRAGATARPRSAGWSFDGAARSADIVAGLVRERFGDGLSSCCEAALDNAPGPVRFWWRDDDAGARQRPAGGAAGARRPAAGTGGAGGGAGLARSRLRGAHPRYAAWRPSSSTGSPMPTTRLRRRRRSSSVAAPSVLALLSRAGAAAATVAAPVRRPVRAGARAALEPDRQRHRRCRCPGLGFAGLSTFGPRRSPGRRRGCIGSTPIST